MSAATATPEVVLQVPDPAKTGLGPILVATDGTPSSDSALRATAQFAQHADAGVVVLTVLEPLPLVAADYGLLVPPVDTEQSRRNALFARVKEQVKEAAGDATGWTIEVRDGEPAAVIARAAREMNARMIVAGIGHHDMLDRLFGGETALHALRLARIPVYAVGAKHDHLPRRAIVATDFSLASVKAARAALDLLDTVTMVYLVHVAPRMELQPEAFAAWMSLYGEGVEPAFARVTAELGLRSGITVEHVTRQGKPSRELIDFARSTGADVIVSGSRGAGVIDRILVGSTATGLIRGAHCAVLAVPTPAGDGTAVTALAREKVVVPAAQWAAELSAFTRRNAGRRASLEVDDPELGAQAQEHDYPLLGVAYDHHDKRVEIMLGDFGSVRRHLTRGISDVHSIDVLRDEHGRDWILRLQHGRGQTILMLAR